MCVCAGVQWMQEESVGSPRAEIAGTCEAPDGGGAGN